MAHNYDPQVRYPPYQANRYINSQYQQPQQPVYPVERPHDPRLPASQAHPGYQNSVDVYPVQRPQTTVPQLSRYPSVQTQNNRLPERHIVAPQTLGIARHPSDPGTNVNTAQTQSTQYPLHVPPPRPATGFAPARSITTFVPATEQSTSPTKSSQFRRPLPQRPGDGTNASAVRRPLPEVEALNSRPAAPSFHRPSYSVDATGTSSTYLPPPTSHNDASLQTSPHCPLPDPIPRSTRSLDLTRSSSPIKHLLGTNAPLPPPGQKFIPLWKRTLPSPAQSTITAARPVSSVSRDQRSSAPAPPSSFESNVHAPPLQRSKTTGIRPLPPSPGQTHAFNTPQTSPVGSTFARTAPQDPSPPKPVGAFVFRSRSRTLPDAPPPPQGALPHRPDSMLPSPVTSVHTAAANASLFRRPVSDSPMSSDSEDLHDNALLRRPERTPSSLTSSSSPTYGILDLPRSDRTASSSQVGDHVSSVTDGHSRKAQSGGPRSLASRIAALTLTRPPQLSEHSSQRPQSSSPPNVAHPMPAMDRMLQSSPASRWPANLPPLPRAPAPYDQYEPQRSPTTDRNTFARGEYDHSTGQPPSLSSPTKSQLPRAPVRDPSPARPLPLTPQSNSPRQASPARQFPSLRHPSPVRSQALPPPSSAGPSSPSRAQAPGPFSNSPRGRTVPQAAVSHSRGIPNLDDAPPPSLRRSPSPMLGSRPTTMMYTLPTLRTEDVSRHSNHAQLVPTPSIATPSSAGSSTFSLSAFPAPPQSMPTWKSPGSQSPEHRSPPQISYSGDASPIHNGWTSINVTVSGGGEDSQNGVPQIFLPGDDDDMTLRGPSIMVGGGNNTPAHVLSFDPKQYHQLRPVVEVDDYPPCLGCSALIIGDAVNAMGGRWHPRCYRCCVCNESLEMLAPIEHEGRLYCSLDYHEKFSPRCYHCHTVIVDPSYITLNDEGLGVRTYHDQHFFCSECGDPFVTPNMKTRTFDGDGPFEGGEIGAGFTVFRGFPYCAKCHAKLRWPKCKKCKKGMAPDSDIIEALGAKWCSDCFVCTSCHSPFRNGRLFLRDNRPFCQDCFEIMIKNEM